MSSGFRNGSNALTDSVTFSLSLSHIVTQLAVNRTLRLAKKKLVSESSIRFGYFFYGCIVFVFLPSYLFKLAEHGWTYLDAVYFSVISLTKIGFGDYVPSKL